jgi:hypothetical protein
VAEIAKWVLASVAWLAGILIIASIDTIKDLKYQRQITSHRVSKDWR